MSWDELFVPCWQKSGFVSCQTLSQILPANQDFVSALYTNDNHSAMDFPHIITISVGSYIYAITGHANYNEKHNWHLKTTVPAGGHFSRDSFVTAVLCYHSPRYVLLTPADDLLCLQIAHSIVSFLRTSDALNYWPTVLFRFILAQNGVLLQDTEHSRGKAFPLQAWTGPWGSRRLRLQNF